MTQDAAGNRTGYATVLRKVSCDGPMPARREVAGILANLMTSAPADQIEAWLAELSVICAKRGGDEFEEGLRIAAYTARLRQYPADVARAALLAHRWRFWPTWDELAEVCDRLVAPRKAMIAALERDAEARADDAQRDRVTPERAAQIMREVWGADE